MTTTFDVTLWAIREIKGKTRTTYRLRWKVKNKIFSESFQTNALAESFRAELMAAQRRGIAFDEDCGLPEPMARELNTRTWYEHACEYVDMIWPRSSPNHRKGIAEGLALVTLALVSSDRGMPPSDELRLALNYWAYNKARRDAGPPPEQYARAIAWVKGNTVKLSALGDAALVRKVLDSLAVKLDGSAAAPATINRKRAAFSGALRYAVELRRLEVHPFKFVNWSPPKADDQVDRRVVVNPDQARALLAAVDERTPELTAFFGCLYYAALRPEEALHLSVDDYEQPAKAGGWGWLRLSGALVSVGKEWSNDGAVFEQRGLKHRTRRATRNVPVSPDLARLLDRHINEFPPGRGGRLFITRRGPYGAWKPNLGQPLGNNAYTTAWRRAREQVLAPTQVRLPLGKRPYDLRHAAVSLWLNAGVPATQVAEWAGHSVNVLMRVYAKCVDGQDEANKRRIDLALGEPATEGDSEPQDQDHPWSRIGRSDRDSSVWSEIE